MVMGKNKVRLTIGGLDYYITTDEDVAYMKNLGEDLDDEITALIHDHPRLSQVQAATYGSFLTRRRLLTSTLKAGLTKAGTISITTLSFVTATR